MNEPTHLDLFSGIGGFSLGFEAAGFRTIAFSEVDPHKSMVLAHHWPAVPNVGDITKLCRRAYDCETHYEDGSCWCQRWNDEFGDCDCIGTDQFTDAFGFPTVITGGVPCQPASALGSMRGALDERWLWPEALRVVRELRPRFAVFENPPSVLVLPDFHRIIGEITALGYDLWWDVIPAAALGAGHRRERVFLVLTDAEYSGRHVKGQQRGQRQEVGRHEHAGKHGGDRILPADADHPRLERHTRDGARRGRRTPPGRPVAPPYFRGRVGPRWWDETHTGIPVLAHGLSAKLVKAACHCAGDAVVPAVAQTIAEALMTTFTQ